MRSFSVGLRFFSKAEDDRIFKECDKLIEEKIRPAFQPDGGDLLLEDVKDGVLIVSISSPGCTECACTHPAVCNELNLIMQHNVKGVQGVREKLQFD